MNFSGAQSGTLDPTNDMFWTWNTGYVTAKLEGRSPVSAAPENALTWHIGGYKAPYATFKLITFPISYPDSLVIGKNASITIELMADIKAWFEYAHPIKIAANFTCTSPGDLAKQIADNFAGMFRVKSIK